MILCTDLDNTLLYSHRKCVGVDMETLVPVDPHQHKKQYSYMTETVYDQYVALQRENRVLFTTARGLDKISRLCLPLPKTVIAAGGSIILNEGQRDINWELQLLVEQQSSGIELIHIVQEYLEKKFWTVKTVDDKYLMCDVHKNSCLELNQILCHVEGLGWDTFIESHYLYFFPKNVNKGRALEYVLPAYNNMVIGAGDGSLDISMMDKVDKFIIPQHSALTFDYPEDNENIFHTQQEDVLASEDIMQFVYEYAA